MKTRVYTLELGDFQRVYMKLCEMCLPWDDKYMPLQHAINLLTPILADNSRANEGRQECQEEKILTLTGAHLFQVLEALECLMNAKLTLNCPGYEDKHAELQQVIDCLKASYCLMIRHLY